MTDNVGNTILVYFVLKNRFQYQISIFSRVEIKYLFCIQNINQIMYLLENISQWILSQYRDRKSQGEHPYLSRPKLLELMNTSSCSRPVRAQ